MSVLLWVVCADTGMHSTCMRRSSLWSLTWCVLLERRVFLHWSIMGRRVVDLSLKKMGGTVEQCDGMIGL